LQFQKPRFQLPEDDHASVDVVELTLSLVDKVYEFIDAVFDTGNAVVGPRERDRVEGAIECSKKSAMSLRKLASLLNSSSRRKYRRPSFIFVPASLCTRSASKPSGVRSAIRDRRRVSRFSSLTSASRPPMPSSAAANGTSEP